jgi:hypothetical protein
VRAQKVWQAVYQRMMENRHPRGVIGWGSVQISSGGSGRECGGEIENRGHR